MHSKLSVQNFGRHTRASLTWKDKKTQKAKTNQTTKQNKNNKKTKKKNPKQQKPPQVNQARKHLFTGVFQNQSHVPRCLVLPEIYVMWRHAIKYDSNQPFP